MSETTDFAGAIGNEITISTEKYAAILGLSPSKGARSPLLWNAAFKAARIKAEMHPLDTTEENLEEVIAVLRDDPRFIGGAVAVPHKQTIGLHLDRVEPEAARIGAVNAIYRDGEDLVGANTDGAGALSQITELVGGEAMLNMRHAVLVGLGGAGVAVAAYLAGHVATLTLCNRSWDTAKQVANTLGARPFEFPLEPEFMENVDLLINATTVGYQDGPEGSPVSNDCLDAMPSTAAVYDVIYQPEETLLLKEATKRGMNVMNGLGMNLDQAVIAFMKANPGALGIDQVRDAMSKA